MSDLLSQALLLQTRQRPRQSASSRLAEQLMRQAGQQGPVYGTMGVLSRALPMVAGAYFADQGDREERADEKRRMGALFDQQREQREEFQRIIGGQPPQQMPAPMPQMPPPQAPMAPMPNAAPMAGGDDPRAMPGYDPMAESRRRLAAMPQGPQELPGGYRAPEGVGGAFAGLAPPTGTLTNLSGQQAAPMPQQPQAQPPGPDWARIQAAMNSQNPMAMQWAQNQLAMAQAMRRETPAPVTVSPGASLVNPQTGQLIFTAPREPRPPSEAERRIEMMTQDGVPPEIARGLVTGRLATRQDPQDGTITVFDQATGRVLFGPNAGGIVGQPATPGAAPEAPRGRVPPGQENSIMPTEGAAYRDAMGAPGLVAESANMIADLFGGRLPAPQVNTAAQALRNLDTRTRMFLQSAIPGRPSNYLMEMIGDMTLSPSTITQGPERAAERAGQTTRFLEQTVRELEEIAAGQGTGRFTRQDIGEANRVLVSLRPLLADYRMLEGALSGGRDQRQAPRGTNPLRQQGAAPSAPEGVDPRVWGAMTPEERALWQN